MEEFFTFNLIIMYVNMFIIAGYYIWYFWTKYLPWFNINSILMSVLFSGIVSSGLVMKYLFLNASSLSNYLFYWFCSFCITFVVNKPFMLLVKADLKREIRTDLQQKLKMNRKNEDKEIDIPLLSTEDDTDLPILSIDTYAKDSESLARKQKEVRKNIRIAENLIKKEIGE